MWLVGKNIVGRIGWENNDMSWFMFDGILLGWSVVGCLVWCRELMIERFKWSNFILRNKINYEFYYFINILNCVILLKVEFNIVVVIDFRSNFMIIFIILGI